MTLVLVGKGLVLGGLTFKNRGHWGSRYTIVLFFYSQTSECYLGSAKNPRGNAVVSGKGSPLPMKVPRGTGKVLGGVWRGGRGRVPR